MVDIAMCAGAGCPLKTTCYRYTARRSEVQSFSAFYTRRNADGTCDYYIPVQLEETEE